MFASLLPGFRDLRTPLAVGLLWIAVAWVWFAASIPDAAAATGLIAQLYRLTGVFGAAVLIAMLTFTGYVVGLMLSSLHLDWPLIRRVLPEVVAPISWQSRQMITQRFEQALHAATDAGLDPIRQSDLMNQVNNLSRSSTAITSDVRLMAMRIQGAHKDIYDDYDRFRAESEFRRSIALPLAVLVTSVAYSVIPADEAVWLVAAWVVSAFLFLALHALSWRKAREGNDLIVQCMLSGQVASPTIEAIEDAANRSRSDARGRP